MAFILPDPWNVDVFSLWTWLVKGNQRLDFCWSLKRTPPLHWVELWLFRAVSQKLGIEFGDVFCCFGLSLSQVSNVFWREKTFCNCFFMTESVFIWIASHNKNDILIGDMILIYFDDKQPIPTRSNHKKPQQPFIWMLYWQPVTVTSNLSNNHSLIYFDIGVSKNNDTPKSSY